jgi:hypothetical protein
MPGCDGAAISVVDLPMRRFLNFAPMAITVSLRIALFNREC